VTALDAALPDNTPAPFDAGSPERGQGADAGPQHSLPAPLVLLHLSDIHIGSGGFAIPALELAMNEILPVIDPLTTFATGDLVEVGNDLDDWEDYRVRIDGAGLSDQRYIEIPGNHDIYLDLDLSNYLEHTIAGRHGHGTYGLYHLDTAWGRLRVVALSTVSSGDQLRDSTGYLSGGQVDELIASMAADAEPVANTIVLGHHPADIDGLGLFNTDDELTRVLEASSALAYLYGHRHYHYLSWQGEVLFAMARTLGNPGEEASNRAGFNVLVIDDGPAIRGVPIDEADHTVDWPVVMITRPADAAIGGGNPLAEALERASADHLLRAVVFSPEQLPATARYRVDQDPWQPMVLVGSHFEAWFDTPDAAGCVLEVEASDTAGVASDTVEVELR